MSFLVVDFEFSMKMRFGSPRAWFPEIIEIGALLVDDYGNLTKKQYGAFVKPRFWPRLVEECYGITGIRQKDVDNGISMEEALKKLQSMADSQDIWLVAWGDADRRVLKNVCMKYGMDYPFVFENYVDLAYSYRNLFNLEKMSSLKRAIETTKVQMVGIQHSAMDDAINAALVMQKMILSGWVVERALLGKDNEPEHGKNGYRRSTSSNFIVG